MPISNKTPLWYAVYTMPRWEKKVLEALTKQEIMAYSPIQKKLKQWSDRKKWVEEPAIRGYVFVKIKKEKYFKVLNTDGVLRFVCFERKAVPIPEFQIEILKNLIENNIDIEMTQEQFEPGNYVEIERGPLKGISGELISYKGAKKVLLRLENFPESMLVSISPTLLKKISK